jgi:hypothetical protein
MIVLRLAAAVAAVVTIALNAHHGFKSAATLEYAVMFAALNAALDISKCTLIPIGMHAMKARRWAAALAAFTLFPLLFVNSVWNAVSQVAISRDAGKATAVADLQAHQRAAAEHKRLLAELALMQASRTFETTAACTRTMSRTARTFCSTIDRTKADMKAAAATLASSTPVDPQPQITLLAAITGRSVSLLTLILAVVPVLLAELVGSFGFFIAAQHAPGAIERPQKRFRLLRLGWWRSTPKTPPPVAPAPPQAMVWKIPS